MKKQLISLFIIGFLFTITLFAEWEPDVRLTFDPAHSYTSRNNARSVVAIDDTVHVVWFDDREEDYQIYYKRSIDGGLTWEADIRLTEAPEDSKYPSVAVSGPNVHVIWQDNRDGDYQIYYKRSTDGGVTWETDTRLTYVSANTWYSSVASLNNTVHAVWYDSRDGNTEIYYKRSPDGGLTWEPDIRLTNDQATSRRASIALSETNVHVVWEDDRDEDYYQIYYKRSPDGGATWETDTRLTNTLDDTYYPCIAVSGSIVHVVWYDNRDGDREIYYKRSNDAGITWETDVRLTNDPASSNYPSVTVSGSNVHLVWRDTRVGDNEVYYKRSIDEGTTWGPDERLTYNPANLKYPCVAISNSTVHVVWQDIRDGNWEIYYKHNPTGSVGIDDHGSLPINLTYLQVTPNPFNLSTTIHYYLPESSDMVIRIYNVKGQLVKTLEKDKMEAGIHYAVWNGRDSSGNRVSSGIYFYKLKSNRYEKIKKMILIK